MKKILYIAMASVLSFTLSSCLKEDASCITSPYDFYQNPAQTRAALNACYMPITNMYNLPYMISVEGVTDLASCNGSAQKDCKLDISPSSTGCGATIWQQSYTGIRYCLSTRAGIERSPMTAEQKAPLYAEATIMLSFYYYMLTSHFGNVPFYEDYMETDEDLDRIGKLPRMDAKATRAKLIDELRNCVPSLPQIRSSEVEKNYCGAAMGWMLMARMAAWNKDWDAVLEAGANLEKIYGSLDQYPYTDVMFRNKNTPESIFEVQHTWSAGGLSKTSNVACICMPYPRTAGTDIYCGVQIPELGGQAMTYASMRPTSYMKNSVMKENQGDLRREYNMSNNWNGVKYNGGQTWMGPKFWCPGMYQTYDSNNYKVFRYAGALLLMSEAWCEKQDLNNAVLYYNMIRSRAGLGGYDGEMSYIKFREELRREFGRELFGEFGRKYDLVRWGTWYTQTLAYNTYDLVQQNIKPCHEYYPIPDTEVMASGGALDNNEYAKYGLGE